MTVSAYAVMIPPEHFQFHDVATDAGRDDPVTGANGIFGDAERTHTRVVEHEGTTACIFLNRPGFAGGEGCALHIAAVDAGDSPTEWKPSVCWQLPLRIDWQEIDDDTESATVRRWTRSDWGDHGTDDGVVLHRTYRRRRGLRRRHVGRRLDARRADRPRRRARLRRAAPPPRYLTGLVLASAFSSSGACRPASTPVCSPWSMNS